MNARLHLNPGSSAERKKKKGEERMIFQRLDKRVIKILRKEMSTVLR